MELPLSFFKANFYQTSSLPPMTIFHSDEHSIDFCSPCLIAQAHSELTFGKTLLREPAEAILKLFTQTRRVILDQPDTIRVRRYKSKQPKPHFGWGRSLKRNLLILSAIIYG